MRLKNIFMFMTAFFILFVSAFAAEAQPKGPHFEDKGMRLDMCGLRVFLELRLTDSQRAQMMDILNKHRNDRKKVQCFIGESRKELRSLLEAEQFNEEKVRNALRKAYQTREDMFVARAKMMAQLKAVLTPDQQEILKKLGSRKMKRDRPRHEFRP